MITRLLSLFLVLGACAAPQPSSAEENPPRPTATELLKRVRQTYADNQSHLSGSLRDSESGNEEPFDLATSEEAMRFTFNKPPQVVNLDLTTSPATLREVKAGRSIEVPASRYGEKVRGFDLTYEDLSMSFLYWTNAKIMGEDTLGILTGKAWWVRVTTPDARGPYGTVDIWVHQASGAMAKMEGWDRNGKRIKRFEVRSLQKDGEIRIPKEIREETYAPGAGKTGTTYMTFDPPAKK